MKPVNDLKTLLKEWEQIKNEIKDTECGGETFEFLSEWSSETSTAQHSLWRGCERIVELCLKINNRLNMSYSHPVIPLLAKDIYDGMSYVSHEEDLGCLTDYFYAALDQKESKAKLIKMWEREMRIIRAHPVSSGGEI